MRGGRDLPARTAADGGRGTRARRAHETRRALHRPHDQRAVACVRRIHAELAAGGGDARRAGFGWMEGARRWTTGGGWRQAGGVWEGAGLRRFDRRAGHVYGRDLTGSIAKIDALPARPLSSTPPGPNAGQRRSRRASTRATIVKVFTEAALGNQTVSKVKLGATYLVGDFAARFSLALARKDLGLVRGAPRDLDADASQCARQGRDGRGDRARLGRVRRVEPLLILGGKAQCASASPRAWAMLMLRRGAFSGGAADSWRFLTRPLARSPFCAPKGKLGEF